MNFTEIIALQAAGAQGIGSMLLPMILIFGIMYMLILRPQAKKQKETQRLINNLKKGDKVVTVGGIKGVISSVKEKSVLVQVDDNTKIEFNKSAISGLAETPEKATKERKPRASKKEKTDKKEGTEEKNE